MPALHQPPPSDITTQYVPRGTWVKDCPRLIRHASSTFHSCRTLCRTSNKCLTLCKAWTLISSRIFFKFIFISLGFWTLLLLKLRSPLQASFLPSRSALLWCHAFCWPDAEAVLTPPVPCSTHLPWFIGKEFTSWNGQIRWMGSVGNSLCSLISSDQYRWVIQIKQHMKPSSHRTSVKWESKRWILRVILVLIPP